MIGTVRSHKMCQQAMIWTCMVTLHYKYERLGTQPKLSLASVNLATKSLLLYLLGSLFTSRRLYIILIKGDHIKKILGGIVSCFTYNIFNFSDFFAKVRQQGWRHENHLDASDQKKLPIWKSGWKIQIGSHFRKIVTGFRENDKSSSKSKFQTLQVSHNSHLHLVLLNSLYY